MRILLIVAVILALRFILNLSKYLRTNKYHDAYISWLAIERESKIVAVRAQVVALLKDAGVKDSYVGTVTPAGYGYMATGNASVMDNFPNAREDFGMTGSGSGLRFCDSEAYAGAIQRSALQSPSSLNLPLVHPRSGEL